MLNSSTQVVPFPKPNNNCWYSLSLLCVYGNWSSENNTSKVTYAASSWVKTQTQVYRIQHHEHNHSDKLPYSGNHANVDSSAFLKPMQATCGRHYLPKILPFSCRVRSLFFVGHRASILGWSNQSSWMWPSQGGDAGPGLQENLCHCTVPTTSATLHLLVGPWRVGRKTSLESEGQQSAWGFA